MIWVIGAKGMLGTEVCRQLSEKKYSFVGTGHEIDITDYNVMEKFIQKTETQNYLAAHKSSEKDPEKGKIKWILNCSAYTDVENAENEPETADNVNNKGVLNIARIARSHGAKLIHISTDYVFNGSQNSPIPENAKKNPINTYGLTKSLGEDQIVSSMTQYYIIRTSWLYGYSGKNFVRTIINQIKSNDEIKVTGDQTGSPTFCGDLADVIIQIIEKTYRATGFFGKNSTPAFGIYNYSNKGQTNWFDFAKKIQFYAGKYGKIKNESNIISCTTSEYGMKARRPIYSVLDKTKIEKELKIHIPEWQQSLESFIKNKKFNEI